MNAPECIALHIEVGFKEGKLSAKDAVKLAVETIRQMNNDPYPDTVDTPAVQRINARLQKRLGW